MYHIMVHNGTQNVAKSRTNVAREYHCEKCDYTTSKTSDWKKHLKTKKHSCPQMTTDDYKRTTQKEKKGATIKSDYICECGRSYVNRQSP